MRSRISIWFFPGLLVMLSLIMAQPARAAVNNVNSVKHLPGPVNLTQQYATGAKQMTAEQWKNFHKKHARILRVHLNHLGLTRVNQERAKKGLQVLDESLARPAGAEIESAVDPNVDLPQAAAQTSVMTMAATPMDQPLPAAVDNSTQPWFPVIGDQGGESSCVAFSTTYYQLTYMYAASKGWTVGSDLTKIFSPKWTYNMTNSGADNGTSNDVVYFLMETNGAAKWSDFPYGDGNYLSWDLKTQDWQNALSSRINPTQYVNNASSAASVAVIKQLLADGYILTFDTAIDSWQFTTIQQDPTVTTTTPYIGQLVGYWVNGSDGGHGMTIVGYDDKIWVDINGNGQVDPGERGAFKIANSWGAGWGNSGFVWLAYDALNNVSAVSGGPSTGRVGAFMYGDDTVFEISVKPNYTPKMIAKFTISTADRSQLWLILGTSATNLSSPTTSWYPFPFLYGGILSFNGTSTAVPATIVEDFTDILPTSNVTQNYYLGMINNDTTHSTPSTLSMYQLIDLTTNNTVTQSSLNLPVSADGNTAYSILQYTFNNGGSGPVAKATASPASGVVPVTVNFDASASYDTSASIVSYNWNFGDGGTGSGKTTSHVFTSVGVFNVTLTITDSQGLISTCNVVISAIQLLPPQSLTATSGNAQVTLTWSTSEGAASYNVKRSNVSGGPYTAIAHVTGTSYIDTTVVNGTIYYYAVSAVSGSGLESANSPQAQGTPTIPQQNLVAAAEAAINTYFATLLSGNDATAAKNAMNAAISQVTNATDQQTVHAYYERMAVSTAQTMINNYFKAVLAGTSVAAPQTFFATVMQPVLDQADQQTVQAYYERIAVSTAETQINSYFAALLAGKSVASAQTFLSTVMQPVLVSTDQQTVQGYYERVAVGTAETQINNYFKALLAGTSVATPQTFFATVMQPVLVSTDQQTVQGYYERVAVGTAETQINNYFKALLAGTSVATPQTFLSVVMQPVLVSTDQQTVQGYYERVAVGTAETQINNYFTALLAGKSVASAQTFISTVMQPVLVSTDQQTVQGYYERVAVGTAETQINSYFKALLAGTSVATPQTFLSTVMQPVLASTDQQTVQGYYERVAVGTAETQINSYFSAILAGTSVATPQTFFATVMQPVLVSTDQQTVQGYYERVAVGTAETQINNYFKALLAGTSVATPQTFLSAVMQPVLVSTDQQTVQGYYERVAVGTAETQINNYFTALLAGKSVASAQTFISTVMQPVLVSTDQQTVQGYYERVAVGTAETQINNYFKALLAGTSVATPQTFLSTVMQPVLVSTDQQTVQGYYERVAVGTAETQINSYFSAILAGTSVATPQTFFATMMQPVLVSTDQQTVQGYYERVAVGTAETQINNYFKALLAGTSVATPQTFLSAVMQPVLSSTDQQTVQGYYERMAVGTAETQINSYFKALLAGTSVAAPQTFYAAMIQPVLASTDQQTVYAYYERIAVGTAETEINNYFAALKAGQTVPPAQTFLSTILQPVFATADQKTVQAYFNSKSA